MYTPLKLTRALHEPAKIIQFDKPKPQQPMRFEKSLKVNSEAAGKGSEDLWWFWHHFLNRGSSGCPDALSRWGLPWNLRARGGMITLVVQGQSL